MGWRLGLGGRLLQRGLSVVDGEPFVDGRRFAALLGATWSWEGTTLRIEREGAVLTWREGTGWIDEGPRRWLFPALPQGERRALRLPLTPLLAALRISWEIVPSERLIRIARPDRALASLRVSLAATEAEGQHPAYTDVVERLGHWLELHGVDVQGVSEYELPNGEEGASSIGLRILPGALGDRGSAVTTHGGGWEGWRLAVHMQRELSAEGCVARGMPIAPFRSSARERFATPWAEVRLPLAALRPRADEAAAAAARESVAVALFRALRRAVTDRWSPERGG